MSRLSHDELLGARRHPAWRLLVAENAPLVLGFLAATFLEPNVRTLPRVEVADALEDYLGALRTIHPAAYPRPADAYLTEWSKPEVGWLRRHYPPGQDTAHFEPTAAVEVAAAFVRDLGPREFVGTASRLLTVRDLLRQITAGAATDPEVRLAALERQRDEIDAAITAIRAGSGAAMDPTAIRERYAQVVGTARALLADLRAVEASMRELDRSVRARATAWGGPRGELLESIFGSRDSINSTDQGRSWQAFWEHLLSSRAQDELDELLAETHKVPALAGRTGEAETLLRTDLFHAAEGTQRTVASLSAQLRRFLDDAYWAESRRVTELIRDILAAALAVVGAGVDTRHLGAELPDLHASIVLPLERPLYAPRLNGALDPEPASTGDATEVDLTDLLEVDSIDTRRLEEAIDAVVAARGSSTLGQVVADHPLNEGLAELVGYLEVSDDRGVVTGGREQIRWTDPTRGVRVAELPAIVYTAHRPTAAVADEDRIDR